MIFSSQLATESSVTEFDWKRMFALSRRWAVMCYMIIENGDTFAMTRHPFMENNTVT